MADDRRDLEAWIGRGEEQVDVIVPSALDRLAATLGRDEPPVREGAAVPPLAHWLFCVPTVVQAAIGTDGHPSRGGFLPPVHDLPRRMWAGGRLAFPGTLHAGARIRRASTIASVTPREGRSGPLVFVTVRHAIGEEGGPVAITEEHDIVYRGAASPAVSATVDAPPPAPWQRTIVPDPVLLFRYSALTFNGHRIHYDRSYVTEVEGYPGLVVHGPLIATLLADLMRLEAPERRLRRFDFRAFSPAFDGQELVLNATPPDAEGESTLWASDGAGRLLMRAEATVD